MARWLPSGLNFIGVSGANAVKACPSLKGWVILVFRMAAPYLFDHWSNDASTSVTSSWLSGDRII